MSIEELKEKYLKYYETCPIKKYAAAYIGRDYDTILRWEKEDAVFAVSAEAAKARWVARKVHKASPKFALERLEHQIFGPKTQDFNPLLTQFDFIFNLKPDELRRFIKASITRAGFEIKDIRDKTLEPSA